MKILILTYDQRIIKETLKKIITKTTGRTIRPTKCPSILPANVSPVITLMINNFSTLFNFCVNNSVVAIQRKIPVQRQLITL